MSTITSLGRRVYDLRTDAGMTQPQLAAAAKCSTAMVGAIERGERIPHLVMAQRIAHGLGTTLPRLIEGTVFDG